MIKIKPFQYTEKEYQGLVALNNVVYPDAISTVSEYRYSDENRNPKCVLQRYIFEKDEQIIASYKYQHIIWSYHPQRLFVAVNVHPEHRNQGIGSMMYDHLASEMQLFNLISLRAFARENEAHSVYFAEKRGFKEIMREVLSFLDITKFEPTAYDDVLQKVNDMDIKLISLEQFMDIDPDHKRKLYKLDRELSRDLPSHTPETPMDFMDFEKEVFSNPNLLPDGWTMALHGNDCIGVSMLFDSKGDKTKLYTGLTGVRRPYRRQGIAIAMKVKSIMYAKEHGFARIQTENDQNNPMFLLNQKLGFVAQPSWIEYEKLLRI